MFEVMLVQNQTMAAFSQLTINHEPLVRASKGSSSDHVSETEAGRVTLHCCSQCVRL